MKNLPKLKSGQGQNSTPNTTLPNTSADPAGIPLKSSATPPTPATDCPNNNVTKPVMSGATHPTPVLSYPTTTPVVTSLPITSALATLSQDYSSDSDD